MLRPGRAACGSRSHGVRSRLCSASLTERNGPDSRPGGWTGGPRTFELVRTQVKVPSVASEVLAPRIGYLAIRRFQEATATDASAALRALIAAGAADVILLDLRTDSGGLIDQAIKLKGGSPTAMAPQRWSFRERKDRVMWWLRMSRAGRCARCDSGSRPTAPPR